METLLKSLKNYSIDDCYAIEENSKEFANLSIIFNKIDNKEFFLPLVLASWIVFYSLSNAWDKYWEKVWENIECFNFKKIDDVYLFFIDFLPKLWINDKSIWKKIVKLKKIRSFLDDLYFKQTFYHKNMLLLSKKIAEYSWTLFDDLIVTYSVRMYAYWARIRFNKHIEFPQEFLFVVNNDFDSLYKRYDGEFEGDSQKFYLELSKQLNIAPMHLKLLLIKKFDELMKMDIWQIKN